MFQSDNTKTKDILKIIEEFFNTNQSYMLWQKKKVHLNLLKKHLHKKTNFITTNRDNGNWFYSRMQEKRC
jgi:hypothetical protein